MLSFAGEVPRFPNAAVVSQTQGDPPTELTGLRVLVVEDEAMVAMIVEDALLDLGCVVVGPVGHVAAALRLLDEETVDAAVLDVNLGGEMVFPVADRLAQAGIPFLFSTGYGLAGITERHIDRPVLKKPFNPGKLGPMLSTVLRRNAEPW